MKVETHLHSLNGSGCGAMQYDDILRMYKNGGYDAVILTEHYSKGILEHFFEDTPQNKRIDRFLNNYHAFEKAAKSIKIKAFFGAELGYLFENGEYLHLLAIGTDENFFKDADVLSMNEKQLYNYCTEQQVYLAQAHPFRPNIRLATPEYLDGAEVYNGASDQGQINAQSLDFAQKNNLKRISGSDFHRETHFGKGGIIVPDGIKNTKELAHFLKFNQPELIINGEVNDHRI